MAVVESLRSVWFHDQNVGQEIFDLNPDLDENDLPLPIRITIEYPEEEHDWPFILVQLHPNLIEWTGVMPDEVVDSGTEGAPQFKLIRQGRFEATCMLQIMALSSGERDRIWDNLVNLIMMGRKRVATRNFYTSIENHDLVGITIMEGSIDAVGDTISMGTPWDPELLSYEATIQFSMTGVWYTDEYDEDLVPLKEAKIYSYVPIATDYQSMSLTEDGIVTVYPDTPKENDTILDGSDGQGSWREI